MMKNGRWPWSGESVWGPPEALLPFTTARPPLPNRPWGACRRSYSHVLALGPIYYEKPFWLIKKVFQSLRTGSSEIFLSCALSMGVGANLAPGLVQEGGEREGEESRDRRRECGSPGLGALGPPRGLWGLVYLLL